MTRRAPLRAGLVAVAIFLAMGVLWSFGSPLGSVPDETAHIAKATATARGEWTGAPDQGEGRVGGQRIMEVPGYVIELGTEFSCHYFRADVTASCPGAAFDETNADLGTFSTTAGLYNPVYYVAVGWPSLLLDQEASLYGMRIASAVLNALLMGIAASMLVLAGAGRAGLVALVAGSTPMVAYLSGSVNPNGFEVTAAIAFLAAGLAAFRRPAWSTMLATGVTGALLLNGRSITPLWAAVIALVLLVLATWPQLRQVLRHPATWVAVGMLAIASAFSLWWTLTTGVLSNGVAYEGAGTPPLAGLLEMLARTFDYFPGAVAVLGWLDVPAPIASVAIVGGAILAAVVAGIVLGDRRERVALAIVVAATALLPAIVTSLSVEELGFIWQGRYILALLVPMVVVGGVVVDRGLARAGLDRAWPRSLGIVIGVLVAACHAFPIVAMLKRYSVGLDATIGDFVSRREWEPPGTVPLLLAGWVVVLAAVVAVVAWASAHRAAATDGTASLDAEPVRSSEADADAGTASGAGEQRADPGRVAVDHR